MKMSQYYFKRTLRHQILQNTRNLERIPSVVPVVRNKHVRTTLTRVAYALTSTLIDLE
jgi:hypothetical protein